jgi:hypothetical protein
MLTMRNGLEENTDRMIENTTYEGRRQSLQTLHPEAQELESWSIRRHFGSPPNAAAGSGRKPIGPAGVYGKHVGVHAA